MPDARQVASHIWSAPVREFFRKRDTPGRWDRRLPRLQFGKHDVITLGDAYENIAVLGGVGSGKTSGSSYHISKSMLQLGMGGIVLTAKAGEAGRWRRLCELTGRSEDLVVIDDQSDWQFNFLEYQYALQGRSARLTENLVAALDSLMKVAERATGMKRGQGQEQFWEQGIRKHARAVIALILYSTRSISVKHMLEVMRAVPRSVEQAQDAGWQSDSLICHLLAIARNQA